MKKEELTVPGYKPVYKGVPPFMKYEAGFGYYGVLLEEEKTGKLQCHICGHTALNIAKHIFHKHKDLSPQTYKEKVGLNLTTPLMSESTRKKIKNNFLNLPEADKVEVVVRLQKLNKQLHLNPKKQRTSKASLEANNKFGTCPLQVRSQFYETYNSLGRIPIWTELSYKLRYIIETRFGSYEEALVAWGISREEYRNHRTEAKIKAQEVRRDNDYFPKFSEEEVKKQYLEFFSLKKRLPTWGEVQQYGMPGRVPFERVFGCSKKELENSLTHN